MPTTVREAADEYRYWAWRTYMAAMSIACDGETPAEVLSEPFEGDQCLDLSVVVRLDLLTPLLLEALPAKSIDEIDLRLAIHEKTGMRHPLLDAVRRDLATVWADRSETSRRARTASDPTSPKRSRAPGVQDARITDELKRDPTQSDRTIARKFDCSPATVGKERGRLGLKGVVRRVQRGGKTYSMPNPPKSKKVAAPAEAVTPVTPPNQPSPSAVIISTPIPKQPKQRKGRAKKTQGTLPPASELPDLFAGLDVRPG